jgi:cytochrome c oxidase assembly protein subunit 15
VGLLTLVLAVWTAVQERRRGVRRLAWGALLVVCLQGLLGGLTVLFFTPLPISVAHACLAQSFLCVMVALAYATSREWTWDRAETDDTAGMRPAATAATAGVFVQLVLGALMRHAEAGLAIPDFPLAFGRLVPPQWSLAIAVHFAHRLGALAVVVLVARLFAAAARTRDVRLARPAAVLAALVLGQITLGATIILTRMAVYPTTTHVALGAAILATTFFLTLRAHHLLRRPAPARIAAGSPVLAR